MAFQPVNLGFEELSTAELLGESPLVENCLLKQTKVTLLAGISAFVGADITAGLWGCGMNRNEKPHLFLDLGTNAEMAVGNKEGMLVSSAAAGPALRADSYLVVPAVFRGCAGCADTVWPGSV